MTGQGTSPKKSWWVIAGVGIAGVCLGGLLMWAVGPAHVRQAPVPAVATPAGDIACGPDQQAALEAAFARLQPEPVTGQDWSGVPKAGNYRPCADLSAIVVTVVGATGSSPTEALLFHRGIYVGPATAIAYGFTSLDAAASTDDTVVLTYRTGQSCTACGDGVLTTVRFHWDGTAVRILDPLPPG